MLKAALKLAALLTLLAPNVAKTAPPLPEQYGPPLPPVNLTVEIAALQREATALHAKAQELEASFNHSLHGPQRHPGGSQVVRADDASDHARRADRSHSYDSQDASRTDSSDEQE